MFNILSALNQNESQGPFSGEGHCIFFKGQPCEMRTLWNNVFSTQKYYKMPSKTQSLSPHKIEKHLL